MSLKNGQHQHSYPPRSKVYLHRKLPDVSIDPLYMSGSVDHDSVDHDLRQLYGCMYMPLQTSAIYFTSDPIQLSFIIIAHPHASVSILSLNQSCHSVWVMQASDCANCGTLARSPCSSSAARQLSGDSDRSRKWASFAHISHTASPPQ